MPYNAILQWAHNNFVSIHGSNERSTLWQASIVSPEKAVKKQHPPLQRKKPSFLQYLKPGGRLRFLKEKPFHRFFFSLLIYCSRLARLNFVYVACLFIPIETILEPREDYPRCKMLFCRCFYLRASPTQYFLHKNIKLYNS